MQPLEHGVRADVFLSRRIRRLSRSRAADIIRGGFVRRDGGQVIDKPSSRLFEGDRILMKRKRLDEAPIDDIVVPVVYEDDDILAVNKPGDLVVHPTASAYHRTLIRVLRARRPGQYLDLAHRIDKETSGLILLGKTPAADVSLKNQFADREVSKAYLAIVVGAPEKDSFTVDAPMRLVPGSETGVLMEVGGEGASEASTEVEVRARSRTAALVEARPKTGRQHQIRVHLAHAGHTIVGDKLYLGGEEVFIRAIREQLDRETVSGLVGHWRQALHAFRATFTHPRTKQPMTLEAPLAGDLVALAAAHGLAVTPDHTARHTGG